MMGPRELVIVALLLAACGDLPVAWAGDPRVRGAPVALALWAFAAWRARTDIGRTDAAKVEQWRVAALIASACGAIFDVNALSHAGVAVWFAGSAPRHRWLLVVSAPSWFPMLARLLPASPGACNAARVILAGVAALAVGCSGGSSRQGGSRCLSDASRRCS